MHMLDLNCFITWLCFRAFGIAFFIHKRIELFYLLLNALNQFKILMLNVWNNMNVISKYLLLPQVL